MTYGLTKRQPEALAFIRQYHAENGRVPTYRALAAALGLRSPDFAHRIVMGLIERGYFCCVDGGYEFMTASIPSEPLQHGYVFIPVHELPQSSGAAA